MPATERPKVFQFAGELVGPEPRGEGIAHKFVKRLENFSIEIRLVSCALLEDAGKGAIPDKSTHPRDPRTDRSRFHV
jgi:hypothetical protein